MKTFEKLRPDRKVSREECLKCGLDRFPHPMFLSEKDDTGESYEKLCIKDVLKFMPLKLIGTRGYEHYEIKKPKQLSFNLFNRR